MRLKIIFIIINLIFFGWQSAQAARPYQPVGQASDLVATSRPVTSTSASQFSTPSGNIKLFGTVEFKRPIDSLPSWLDVLRRNASDPIFVAQKQFNKTTGWKQLQATVSGKPAMEQLKIINAFWNGWPYREDMSNWGKPDYWAIPAQFLKKSGDCEDYAIVKYFTLKELGFDPHDMRIVVLRDTIRNLPHAVLVVFINNDAYVLDNLSNVVLSHRRLANYSPQYSVNEFGRWAHVKPKK